MGINYSPKIVTNGLVLCLDAANPSSYPGSGSVWKDLSGNNNNGNFNNPIYISNNGGSIVFDGADDEVYILNNNSINIVNKISLCLWIYMTKAFDGYPGIISKGYATTGGYSIHIRGGYDLWFELDESDGTRNIITGGFISLNTWHYICCTYDGSSMKIFQNNNLVSSPHSKSFTIGSISSNIAIGRLSGYGYFGGRIPLVKIYNNGLSANEVSQNYNATKGRFAL
jgi:hypothetical protein